MAPDFSKDFGVGVGVVDFFGVEFRVVIVVRGKPGLTCEREARLSS